MTAAMSIEQPMSTPSETEVLKPDECRAALKLSRAQWFRIAPKLPVTYALGEKTPRYIWGDVLAYLRRTQFK